MLARIEDPGKDVAWSLEDAVRSRRSVRAFLPSPVDVDLIRDILELASRAPSGANMQPWKVYVATGRTLRNLVEAVMAAAPKPDSAAEYSYYPDRFFEPYLDRRRSLGRDLYGALGIGRREVDRMRGQNRRNYVFFGAPAGIVVTVDRRLNKGSWIDLGMFVQTLALAARAKGLHTCVQAAFAPFHDEMRPVLGIPDEEMVACGISLGYEDASKPENGLRTDRAPLEDWAVFGG